VIAIIGTICGCFTYRDVSPGRPFPITRSSSEDCKADKAQACYEAGLALTEANSSTADRAKGITLLQQACTAKLSAACDTLERRFQPPKKISGASPRYTRAAVWDGVTGRITVKCLLTTAGILRDCAVVAPRTEKEREILETSGQAAELLKTISTWRYTPAQLDGQPCEIEYDFRVQLALR